MLLGLFFGSHQGQQMHRLSDGHDHVRESRMVVERKTDAPLTVTGYR